MKPFLFFLPLAVLILNGCSNVSVTGDGVIKTEARTVSEFSKLAVTGGYEVEWTAGKPALIISADENLLPLIKTVVSGGTLTIDSKDNFSTAKNIKVILSSPSLSGVELTGGNDFTASQLSGQSLNVESTGASDINLSGSVTNLAATLTGASKLKAKSFPVQNCTLALVGASEADVTVSGAFKVSVTGASSVTYAGNPKTVDKEVTGAGSIKQQP
jgi:hypothetical protein